MAGWEPWKSTEPLQPDRIVEFEPGPRMRPWVKLSTHDEEEKEKGEERHELEHQRRPSPEE